MTSKGFKNKYYNVYVQLRIFIRPHLNVLERHNFEYLRKDLYFSSKNKTSRKHLFQIVTLAKYPSSHKPNKISLLVISFTLSIHYAICRVSLSIFLLKTFEKIIEVTSGHRLE